MSVNPAEVDSLLTPVQKLRASFGIDAWRIDAVGCLLAGGAPQSLDELVSATGTPRRTVEAQRGPGGRRGHPDAAVHARRAVGGGRGPGAE